MAILPGTRGNGVEGRGERAWPSRWRTATATSAARGRRRSRRSARSALLDGQPLRALARYHRPVIARSARPGRRRGRPGVRPGAGRRAVRLASVRGARARRARPLRSATAARTFRAGDGYSWTMARPLDPSGPWSCRATRRSTRSRPPYRRLAKLYHPDSAGVAGTAAVPRGPGGLRSPDRGAGQAAFGPRRATAPGRRRTAADPWESRQRGQRTARDSARCGSAGPSATRRSGAASGLSEPVRPGSSARRCLGGRARRRRPGAGRERRAGDGVGRGCAARFVAHAWSRRAPAAADASGARDPPPTTAPSRSRSNRSGRVRAGTAGRPERTGRSIRASSPTPASTVRTTWLAERRTGAGRRRPGGHATGGRPMARRPKNPVDPRGTPPRQERHGPAASNRGPARDDGWTVPPVSRHRGAGRLGADAPIGRLGLRARRGGPARGRPASPSSSR